MRIRYQHTAVTIDSALLNKYLGNYVIPNVPNATKMELIKKDGKLFCHYEDGITNIELKPESATKFFNDNGVDNQIEFELDSSGKVQKAFYIFKSMKKEIK